MTPQPGSFAHDRPSPDPLRTNDPGDFSSHIVEVAPNCHYSRRRKTVCNLAPFADALHFPLPAESDPSCGSLSSVDIRAVQAFDRARGDMRCQGSAEQYRSILDGYLDHYLCSLLSNQSGAE